MSKSGKDIWAAGGVLWRPLADDPQQVEIGIVHRPRYDDWTLPKGKTEPGEPLALTAVRELAEETGFEVRLGRFLREVNYVLANDTRKHVRYWTARAVGGEFTANHEVDEMLWCSVEEATDRLSYRLDRKILRDFTELPADLHTLLLVRHAKAGRRSRYKGDDRQRPLEKIGRAQAQALAPLLLAFGAQTLHAADRVRCFATFEPLADTLGVHIASEPALSEEVFREDPEATADRMRAIAADHTQIHAVCSQGKVIPPLLEKWAAADGFIAPTTRNRKGSVWVLSIHDGRVVQVDHIDSPFGKTVGS